MTIHSVLYCLSFAAVVTSAGRMGGVTSRRWFPSLICAALLACMPAMPGAFANDNKPDKKELKAQAEALLEKAEKLTDIESAGSQPFVYIADTIWAKNGEAATGRFGVAWQRVGRSREQIASSRFRQTEVVSDGKLHRARNFLSPPIAAVWWQSMFAVPALFRKWPKDIELNSGHAPLALATATNFSCIVAKRDLGGTEALQDIACFDNTTGLPLVLTVHYGDNVSTWTFSNYAAVGEKRFPREITYADSAGARAEMKASRLDVFSSFSEDTFQPSAGSTEEPWCEDPEYKNPLKNSSPLWMQQQPLSARAPELSDPYMLVMMNVKGRADKVFFVGTPSNFPERLSANIIYKMQFAVKYCGTQAVPYETLLQQAFPYEAFYNAPLR